MRIAIAAILVLFLACLGALTWAMILPSEQVRPGGLVLDPSRPRPQGGRYVSALPPPVHLNPFTTTSSTATSQILRYTHDNLMWLDPQTGKPVDAVAQLVKTSPDGRRAWFRLRPEARFSDGSSVTLGDVLFTWEVVQDKSVPLGSIAAAMDQILRVEALGGMAFRVHLKDTHFAGVEAMAVEYPVVKRQYFLDQIRRLAEFDKAPVPKAPGDPGFGNYLAMVRDPGPGSGPYRLQSWVKGEELTLVQNRHSWHRQACPEGWNLAVMKVRFLVDRTAKFTAWRNQEIDWLADENPQQVLDQNPAAARSYRLFLYDTLGKGHEMVVWNHRRPYLADKRVRRALTMLFDREGIAKRLLHGLGTPAVSWFKPGHPDYPEDLHPWPFDPDAARKLLAEAGHGPDNPLTVEILAPRENPLYGRILELALPAFEKAGVKLVPQKVPWPEVKERRRRGAWDGYLTQWTHGGPWIDPYDAFHSSQIGRHGLNKAGYQNPTVDRLLEQARRELDPAKRHRLFQEFNRIFHEEQPVTLLVYLRSAILLHKRFQEARPGPLGLVPQLWWVPPGERR